MDGVYVGVDDSKDAAAALAWALRHAAANGLPLTVVTVVDQANLNALWTDRSLDNARDAHIEAARRGVEDLLADVGRDAGLGTGVDVQVKVLCGHPVKELVEAATNADLLVVGSRGAGGFSRALLGSVSSGVAHHAHCPVTVVKP